ncbi:neo-calmodulin-like isoform X3 [Clytia hemisphaerica]|uniref:EF-hand domain-containing protein n=1 Tax=Clytia hemisphaerica TaxID=252671 RepID=A0A7M5V9Q3_9CNID
MNIGSSGYGGNFGETPRYGDMDQMEDEPVEEKPAIDEDEWKRRVNEDLVESFSIFDIDGDGEISISELMSVMASVGNDISAEDAEDIFDVVDSNGDGKISFDEFKECMYEKMSQQTVDEDLIGAFEIFDEDKDGYISPTEIQLLFKKLGELISTDEAVEIMKDCDLNKDGLIDFEEFKAFYLKIFENQPTLAEQLVAEAEADEKQKVALAMEEKEASGYPQGEAPSPTDYK